MDTANEKPTTHTITTITGNKNKTHYFSTGEDSQKLRNGENNGRKITRRNKDKDSGDFPRISVNAD